MIRRGLLTCVTTVALMLRTTQSVFSSIIPVIHLNSFQHLVRRAIKEAVKMSEGGNLANNLGKYFIRQKS